MTQVPIQLPAPQTVTQRRVVGSVVEVVTTTTAYEFALTPEPAPPVAEPAAPEPVVLLDSTAQSLELIGEGQALTQPYGFTRALSINGSDREPGTDRPLQNSARCSVSLVEMDGAQVVRHAVTLAKEGDEYGARAQFIKAPHVNDALANFAGRVIRASYEFQLPTLFATVPAGSWAGIGQWKKDMYGKAHIQMNVDRTSRVIWQTYGGSGVSIEHTPFQLVSGTWHRLTQEMNLAAGEFNAFIDGKPVATAVGKLAMANGSVLLYPGILYGNFFKPGEEQVLLTRHHRIEVLS